ncbi:Flagellar hook-basal body complex protein FliE [hydrothermal vent metagenome]|uniref:Flagellar hook-basal body complex protein FliE n=1 Tax=hydrothermal vent metagenome TaxID=652676 RepID=A0A3B1ALD5_9ZZZZ
MSNTISPDTLLAQMRGMIEQSKMGEQTNQVASPTNAQRDAFSNLLENAINTVNTNQQQANQLATAMQKGDPNVQMSEVMVALQKSNISFQAMVEVRNRLVSAYQEIMNMQI